jgi:hypothetical protein
VIKRRLNSGIAWYHSVRNLLSSRVLSKNIRIRIYKIIIFPVVLYGFETLFLALKEKHRLRVFESRVLRWLFGPKRKVTGGWRKLHNEDLHNLYSSADIIRMIKSRRRWTGHVARMGTKRNAYRILVGKPEWKRPVGRPRSGWLDNIKINLRYDGMDRTDSV